MKLEEKINHEYRCFFLDQMRTSRENIFARSGEIECKKKLKKELMELAVSVDEETKELLLIQDNLLESAFRFLMDEKKSETEPVKKAVKRWLISIKG